MKKFILVLLLVFAVSGFAATDTPAPRFDSGGYVMLKEYFDKGMESQKEYILSVVSEMNKFYMAQFASSEKALNLNTEENQRRFVELTKYAEDSSMWRNDLLELKSKVLSLVDISTDISTYRRELEEVKRGVALLEKSQSMAGSNQALWLAVGIQFLFILIVAVFNFISRKAKNGNKS